MKKPNQFDIEEEQALSEARVPQTPVAPPPTEEVLPAEDDGNNITSIFTRHLADPHVQTHMARKIPKWEELGEKEQLIALLSDNEMYQLITQGTWR